MDQKKNNARHLSEDHKEKISKALKGRHLSDETKEKISKSMMGNQNGRR